VENYTLTDTF